jgi:hypothetical protein
MISNETSVLLIITTVLAGIAGYISRIAQKFEDRRDNSYLNILPSIYYSTVSFTKSVEIYRKEQDFKEFQNRIEDIRNNLKDKISTGDVLISQIKNRNETETLLEFYWNLETFRAELKAIEGNEQRQQDFRDSLDKKINNYSNLLKIDTKKLLDEANNISNDIESKLKKYNSFSFKLIILIIALGVIAGTSSILTMSK